MYSEYVSLGPRCCFLKSTMISLVLQTFVALTPCCQVPDLSVGGLFMRPRMVVSSACSLLYCRGYLV